MNLLFKTLYLYCLELCSIKLHCMSKGLCDRNNLDIIQTDVNMHSEDIKS